MAETKKSIKETAAKATTKVKKTVKKAAVKSDAKKVAKNTKDLMKDLRDLTLTELNASLREAKGDLQKTQKMLRQNELPSSHVIRETKHRIARIKTVMSEKQVAANKDDKETK